MNISKCALTSSYRHYFPYISNVRVPFLDLNAVHSPIRNQLEEVFSNVLDESYFVYGKDVTEFERSFAGKHGMAQCLAVGNCTDALNICLKMLGIGAGDEVIVPAMTWITDAEVVSNLGAAPVFVDVDADTYTLDIDKVKAAITPKTKAIIPVHLFGQMVDMKLLMELARSHDIKVIEDCAQSHFAEQSSEKAGSIGHAAVFSFYPTKNLGALGDAGAILTNDKDLYNDCRKLANHGAPDKHGHEFPGMNSRMDTLQAAILNLKLQYIDKWNEERRGLAKIYSNELSDLSAIQLPKTAGSNTHVFHVYNILTEYRDDLKQFLKEEGIQTQIHYPKALPFTQAYAHLDHDASDFPNSYRMQEEGLSLPLFPGMTLEQQSYVIEKIRSFFQK